MTTESHTSLQVRKRREAWFHWTGTPADLADAAELALALAQRDGRTAALTVKVTAPAFEATFKTGDQLRDGLTPEDVRVLSELVIDVEEDGLATDRRRIAVTVAPPPKQSSSTRSNMQPAISMLVAGQDRDWVDLAALRLTEQLSKGSRATPKIQKALIYGLVLVAAAAMASLAIFGDHKRGLNAGEVAAIIFGGFAGTILLLLVSLDSITPGLELLPVGGTTRWARIKQRSNISGRWLLDAVLKAAIGAGVVLLIQHL
jgi:hypothetical protein